MISRNKDFSWKQELSEEFEMCPSSQFGILDLEIGKKFL
jgi:hypothetical protein